MIKEFIMSLVYAMREAENEYLDSNYKKNSWKELIYDIVNSSNLSEEERKMFE